MKPPRVFMLEDNQYVLTVIQEAVEGQGWKFDSAERAEGVLDRLRAFEPDAIILDIQLPDGNGYEVCAQIRRDPALAMVPVMFLTVKGDVDSRVKGFAVGGQDYVSKPFAIEELVARLRSHLGIKRKLETYRKEKEDLAVLARVRQDLSDMIVHDLKEPLGTIKITLGMLRDTGWIKNTDYEVLLKNSESAAEFLLFMVNDILDVGRGRLEVEPARLEIAPLLERAKAFFASRVGRHRLGFELQPPAATRAFVTDASLLFRILVNLLSNAIKFSRTGQWVTLSAYYFDDKMRVEVADKGPGIPDAEKEKVFEKYYRAANAASRQAPGTGIGLAFCKLAAEALGGRIWVEDGPGGGSRFIVEVPDMAKREKK